MKRAVYEAIGGLDERFGLGFFDDDDLAERARRAGFELAVAHDLFVHHFGSRTFVGNGVDADKLLDENARRFAAKWGLTETRRQAASHSTPGRRAVVFRRQPAQNSPARSTRRERPCAAIEPMPQSTVKPNGTSLPRAESDFASEWKLPAARRCKSAGHVRSNPACARARSA